MKKLLLLIFFLPFTCLAQKYTISGYVKDNESGEALIGASVFDKKTMAGTTTNNYGFFSITLPGDSVHLVIRYVGYKAQSAKMYLNENATASFELTPILELGEIEVSAERVEKIETSTQMSRISIPVEQIRQIPTIMGEADVIKVLQLMPGVQSGVEGASGLYVRGGGPDQNLILLDGTPVYNASHLFGAFSVFNPDAIQGVELIKGGFPARYGGRLSSVIDIHMKEGNMKKFQANGSLGMIASKLTVEGPIKKDKTSFIVSGRRTYFDLITQPIIRLAGGLEENEKVGYFFYDLNAKINHTFSQKDRLYLSTYMGRDKFYNTVKPYSYVYEGIKYTQSSDSRIEWGNITTALRWNHQFTPKLFSNLTLNYSEYDFLVKDERAEAVEDTSGLIQEEFSRSNSSGIDDISARIDFDYLPHPDHFVKFGTNYTYHTFTPGITSYKIVDSESRDIDTTLGGKNIYANEFMVFAEDDWKISDKLKANIGLHASGFLVKNKFYYSFQPRLSARYLLRENVSVKASYAAMQQYIHLLTNNNIGLPTDLWVPATDKVPPQQSHQFALGFASTLKEKFLFSMEGYYKSMNGLITYKEGATFLDSEEGYESKVETGGRGWSYGMEVLLQKKLGNTSGWIGYTLSWTKRQFEEINFGETFPYKYDRRNDISVTVSQKLDDLWSATATFVYGTGYAITLPTVRYTGVSPENFSKGYSGNEIEYFEKRNGYRMANYMRIDVGFQNTKEKKWGERVWSFGAYNLLNRRNPFYYYFGYDNRGHRALRQVSLFPLMPYVNLSFKIN